MICVNIICSQSLKAKILFPVHDQEAIIKHEFTPKLDMHIAVGFTAGGRVGLRYLFENNFSTEIAFGLDLRNFVYMSDFQRRYTLGISYHLNSSDASFSFLTTYVEQPYNLYEAVLLSPNFGLIPIRSSGISVFFRFGLEIELIKDFPSQKWKYNDIGPNLDIGISYNFNI